jgi:hypothetical protein
MTQCSLVEETQHFMTDVASVICVQPAVSCRQVLTLRLSVV